MDARHLLDMDQDADAPEKLEALFREDPSSFAEHLSAAIAQRPGSILLRAWSARFAPQEASENDKLELWLVVIFALLAGVFVKLPDIFPIAEFEFYERNLFLGPLGALTLYLLHTRGWPRKATLAVCVVFGLTALYLNLLPEIESDSTVLVLAHGPLFLWCVAAAAFAGEIMPGVELRRAWVRFFGELVVFSGLLMLGGGILLALTAGLFDLLNVPIDWVFEWMSPMGMAAISVVAAWAVKRRDAGGRVMPLLARIFAPLFLVVLSAYLLRLAVDVQELFDNRETLLMFNVLLLSVLGLTVFSLSGQGVAGNRKLHILLASLLGLTVLFDFVGLAAIGSRIWDMGITPNRLAVLGSNLVVLGNLLLLLKGFVDLFRGQAQAIDLERTTARYLPIFAAWALFVAVFFPLLF